MEAERFPDGALRIPFARHEGDTILDGYKVLPVGSKEWKDWQRSLKALGVKPELIRPTGEELFEAMTEPEQDELFGEEKAQMLRDGEIELADLVQRTHQDEGRVFITPKPLEEL